MQALQQVPEPFLLPKTMPRCRQLGLSRGTRGDSGSLVPQKQRLDRLVCQPLCSLSDMLVGPQQLVKKRLDKLLDYEEIQERKSEMGSVTYDEEAAMNTYLAINALLLAELPRFNQVALQLLGQILCSLSALQRDLAAQVLHQAEKELEEVSLPLACVPKPANTTSQTCLLQAWDITWMPGCCRLAVAQACPCRHTAPCLAFLSHLLSPSAGESQIVSSSLPGTVLL